LFIARINISLEKKRGILSSIPKKKKKERKGETGVRNKTTIYYEKLNYFT